MRFHDSRALDTMLQELKDRTSATQILGLPRCKPVIKPDTGDDHGERLIVPLHRHTERHRPPPWELYGLAPAAPGEGVLPALAGTSMRYPDHHEKAKEPPREQPIVEHEPQDPSLSEHITCLLARQSWIPPKLPLNTPAVTKDVYEFTVDDQQVAKEKYAALLASNLEDADLLGTADMLSALPPNTAAVAIKIPLHNLSQLLAWPACLNAMRVTEAAGPNFSLEKFRTTMLVVALRPVAQFFTRHLQQLKELKSVKEHHASLLMLIDPSFWEAVLLGAMQYFQNTALRRARLAHVYTIGEGYEQRIDRLYVHLPPIAGLVLLHSLISQQKANELYHSIAEEHSYTNMRCLTVSNAIRKSSGKTNKYEVHEILICRLCKKTRGTSLASYATLGRASVAMA